MIIEACYCNIVLTSLLTVDNQGENSKGQTPKRMVSAETVERNWKVETLAAFDANKWLDYDIEKKNAVNLRCKVCTR